VHRQIARTHSDDRTQTRGDPGLERSDPQLTVCPLVLQLPWLTVAAPALSPAANVTTKVTAWRGPSVW